MKITVEKTSEVERKLNIEIPWETSNAQSLGLAGDPGACDDSFGTRAPAIGDIPLGAGRSEVTFDSGSGGDGVTEGSWDPVNTTASGPSRDTCAPPVPRTR